MLILSKNNKSYPIGSIKEAEVSNVLNGDYTLTFKITIAEFKRLDITVKDRIIVDVYDGTNIFLRTRKEQPFLVKEIRRTGTDVEIFCKHESFYLDGVVHEPIAYHGTELGFLDKLKQAVYSNDSRAKIKFNLKRYKARVHDFDYPAQSVMDTLCNGDQSFLSKTGLVMIRDGLEFLFVDKETLYRDTRESGVVIHQYANVKDINVEDYGDVVTRLILEAELSAEDLIPNKPKDAKYNDEGELILADGQKAPKDFPEGPYKGNGTLTVEVKDENGNLITTSHAGFNAYDDHGNTVLNNFQTGFVRQKQIKQSTIDSKQEQVRKKQEQIRKKEAELEKLVNEKIDTSTKTGKKRKQTNAHQQVKVREQIATYKKELEKYQGELNAMLDDNVGDPGKRTLKNLTAGHYTVIMQFPPKGYHADHDVKDFTITNDEHITLTFRCKKFATEKDRLRGPVEVVTVESPYINDYPCVYEKYIDVTDKKLGSREKMIEYGREIFDRDKIDLPVPKIDVSISDAAKAQIYDVYQFVYIQYMDYNVSDTLIVTERCFDPITNKVTKVTLNREQYNYKASLSSGSRSYTDKKVEGIKSDLESALADYESRFLAEYNQEVDMIMASIRDGITQADYAANLYAESIRDQVDQNIALINEDIDNAMSDTEALVKKLETEIPEIVSNNIGKIDFSKVDISINEDLLNFKKDINTSLDGVKQSVKQVTDTVGEHTIKIGELVTSNGELTGKYTALKQTTDGIVLSVNEKLQNNDTRFSTIEQNISSINLAVKGLDDKIAGFKIDDSMLTAYVKKDEYESFVALTDRNLKAKADRIDLQGLVTFKDLDGSKGTTIINGSVIKTGTIDTDQIRTNAITGNKIAANTITGYEIAANTIQGGNIAAGSIDTMHLKSSAVEAHNLYVNEAMIEKLVSNYIFAQKIKTVDLSANQITTGSLSGVVIRGSGMTIDLQDGMITAGYGAFKVSNINDSYGRKNVDVTGGMRWWSPYGNEICVDIYQSGIELKKDGKYNMMLRHTDNSRMSMAICYYYNGWRDAIQIGQLPSGYTLAVSGSLYVDKNIICSGSITYGNVCVRDPGNDSWGNVTS